MNRGFEVVLDGARKDSATFDEYRTLVLAGYRAGVSRRALMLSGAAAVGAGLVGQHTASDNWPASFAVAASASGAVGWRIGRRGSIDLEVEATAALYRREFKLEASIWPALLVGFTVAP
jgi:hypothetical protein